ncbi:PQ loop repeat-domain-containing protein, partial [Gautieria morchelliformis]
MPVNNVAENVLGTIGTVLWTGQILPQIWKSWREHSTEGLSIYLVFLWAVSAIFLGVYNVSQNINIPLIIQPQLFGTFCALSWTQCLHYTHKRPFWFCALVLAAYCIVGAAFETGMVFISQHQLRKGNSRPVQFFGIFASVLIAIGLFPQYWDIWKRKKVVGISYLFMAVDISGGLFSLLSLAFKAQFDIVAAITYALVVVMDAIVLIAAAILNPRARRRRAR